MLRQIERGDYSETFVRTIALSGGVRRFGKDIREKYFEPFVTTIAVRPSKEMKGKNLSAGGFLAAGNGDLSSPPFETGCREIIR